jgi:competence protein ComEA
VSSGTAPVGEYVARPEDLVAEVRSLAGERPRAPDGGGPGRHRRLRPPGRRWARLPASFVGARWQPSRAALAGVVAVVLLAALVFGVRVAWARASSGGDVVAPGGGARAGPTGISAGADPVGLPPRAVEPGAAMGASTQAGTDATGESAGPDAQVVVHVVGRVRHPGVQHLPVGSRVADAVTAAGGATGKADLDAVNLARLLVDGEQIRVPAVGEVPEAVTAASGGVGATPGSDGGGKVSLNTADLAALDTLPGVGPVIAQRIVDWRTAHGRFTSVDELAEVSGIGEKMLAQLRPLVVP